jgi:predicted acyl esterase
MLGPRALTSLRRPGAALATALALAAVAVGLGAAGAGASGPPLASFRGSGSIDEAYATDAPAGAHLELVDAGGTDVGSGVVDKLGGIVVRNVAPGSGYRFETRGSNPSATTPFAVLSTHSTPPQSFYAGQRLHAGLNYLVMRDGITLAATLRLPPGKTLSDGPFPTVIEYSGYNVAGPHSLIDALEGTAPSNDPLLPSTSTVVGSVVTPLLGFATVSLQMRGTGCSGGAFDLFGLDSDYDGYDAVQIVGSQPWVLGHRVGMVGISYSGISQFEVAGTDPPDLAAITPLSPTDDLFSTGYPGGVYNDGFAASWIRDRISDARAAPGGGQPWASAEIKAGDKSCLANQVLHPEAEALAKLVGPGLARTPSLFDQRSPVDWAAHIKVPVFLAGSLQDEQVGPQWPALITALRNDKNVYVTMMNGTHIDSLGPDTISRWLEFLDIYVAGQVPTAQPLLDPLASAVLGQATGNAPSMSPPPIRFTDAPTPAAAAAAYAAGTPRVNVLFDNGGGSLGPGALQPTASAGYDSWPPKGTVTRYYLGPDGSLSATRPARSATASFRPNPAVRPATDLAASANAWAASPPYDWTTVPAGNGIAFETAPFSTMTTVVGPASLDLSLRSSATETDLQVTVTEVRPGGTEEEYITSGFLASSNRTLTKGSTALDPVPTYLGGDLRALPQGRFTLVRIPIDPIAHVFRPGTRLRIVVSAPGGDRPEWAFASPKTADRVLDTVALGPAGGSSLVVNMVSAVPAPAAMPVCGALRGEPCRAYRTLGNQH